MFRLRLIRPALLVLVGLFAGGCVIDELSGNLDETPFARLRGVSANYDVMELWSPAPVVDSSYYLFQPERPEPEPPRLPRVTLWWQTPDEVIHHEDVDLVETIPVAENFAGLLWVEMTPLGEVPERVREDPEGADQPHCRH